MAVLKNPVYPVFSGAFYRKRYQGANAILMIGVMLVSLAVSSLTIDTAYILTFQNQLQTAADAASLAGTLELIKSKSSTTIGRMDDVEEAVEEVIKANLPNVVLDPDDIIVGYVDPVTKSYNMNHFNLPPSGATPFLATGGYNAVRVAIRYTDDSLNGPVGTIMAKVFGVDTTEVQAYSVSLMDQTVSSVGSGGGLRPIYACQAQVNQAFASGNPQSHVAQVYGQKFALDGNDEIEGCPELGTGNWGFADLRDCDPGVPGANDTAKWFDEGYEGTVETGKCYSTQAGNFLSNSNVREAIDKLIANETVILLPVINTFEGTGSNTEVSVSGFVGFVVTGYVSNGSANQRHIEGYFTQALCRAGCTTGNTPTGPGLAVVKLRLASDQGYDPDLYEE
ncbi:MAG: pilus assembly protein TadG-related protein [Vampirovibrionales bacterium]|nr:pilus assembly protein TadG-related protein [Vampirovibrionales bacterium]